MTNNLPEPDDAPWLNLTQEEVEELRYNKQKLTEYGKQRLRELMEEKKLLKECRQTGRTTATTEKVLKTVFSQMTTEELEDFKKMWENPEKIYLPEEDFDAMIKTLNSPPKYIEGLANLMKRKLP